MLAFGLGRRESETTVLSCSSTHGFGNLGLLLHFAHGASMRMLASQSLFWTARLPLSRRGTSITSPIRTSRRCTSAMAAQNLAYPAARRNEAETTTYDSLVSPTGKVTIHDPYHWLEVPPSQSAETKEWVQAQAALTTRYLEGCQPDLDRLKGAIEKNYNYARASPPSKKGDGRYYFSYNAGLAPQSIIYAAPSEEIGTESAHTMPAGSVFFDANLLDAQGNTALSCTAFSESGKFFAYGVSRSGSDWFRIYFRETAKPFALPRDADKDKYISAEGGPDRFADVLDNVKFSGASWTHDDAGIFYQAYPFADEGVVIKGTETDANRDAQLWFHRLGTDQSSDILVIPRDRDCRESMWRATVSDDGAYLVVRNSRDTDTKSRTFVAKIAGVDPKQFDSLSWQALAHDFKYDLDYITNDGGRFYFMTNKDAPNYRVVYTDVDATAHGAVKPVWQLSGEDAVLHDLIPEDNSALLTSVTPVSNDKLLVVYSRDVKDELHQFRLDTGAHEVRLLPDLVGTIQEISCRRQDSEAFVQTASFVNPGQITRIAWTNSVEPNVSAYWSTMVAGIKPDDFVSEQRFFASKDGTQVPMFLTYPKTMPLNGTRPALLYFYGGFNISLPPFFAPTFMAWAQLYGGAIVVVNARGGGEYGDSWHEAGSLLNKQNVFDDVLAAAQFLHTSKVAAKGKIILNGGRNGGLGVAACINQCDPEVDGIGAGIADVGVMDMLKFHTWTIGKAWTADYGNPSTDPAAFDYNLKYSPLHNVDGHKVYPTTILTCADHDDRVVPAHSFKLMAEMQHKLPHNPHPLLLRVELDAGHGAGKSTSKKIAEAAEKLVMAARGLKLDMS